VQVLKTKNSSNGAKSGKYGDPLLFPSMSVTFFCDFVSSAVNVFDAGLARILKLGNISMYYYFLENFMTQ
jgi:hypothetical protein